MKTRESGMPDEKTWEEFFEPETALRALGLLPVAGKVADLGCGYGTFSLSAARMIRGDVIGLDIEPDIIERCRQKAKKAGLGNVSFECRDFLQDGSGLSNNSIDFVMLFNILHADDPGSLLKEAARILKPDGLLAVMHWNHDPKTPRGPSMEIRPQAPDCRRALVEAGFTQLGPLVDLPPWHYGFHAKQVSGCAK